MWFNIDYEKLVSLILPVHKRKNKILALLSAYCLPIQDLYVKWYDKRKRSLYTLEKTGQVYAMEALLNDALDLNDRRIYVTDGDSFPRDYVYKENETKPIFLGQKFINTTLEYLGTGADFNVYAPNEIIQNKIYELRFLIDFYKLASKRYLIKEIL